MIHLEDLPYEEQIKLCQRIAPEILARYQLPNVQLSLLSGGLVNLVFRIEVPMPNSLGVSRAVLRIHRDDCWFGRHSTQAIESELRWLTVLRRETDLVVPEPIAARDGSWVQNIAMDGVTKTIKSVLFGWVEGEIIDQGLTPDHLRKVGVFAARLHEHGLGSAVSQKVHRPRMDWRLPLSPWMHCRLRESCSPSTTVLSENELQVFIVAAESVFEQVDQMPEHQNYGLIHGDLSHRNVLFYADTLGVIDFDGCSWNHHMCELAVTLYFLHFPREHAHREILKDSLLEGYASIRSLPDDYVTQLKLFQTAIHLYIYEGLAYSTDYSQEIAARAMRLLRHIEAGNP